MPSCSLFLQLCFLYFLCNKDLNLAWELKKHESDGDTNCNWCSSYSHRRIGAGTGGLGNKRTERDRQNYTIMVIDQNTEKSPWKLDICCHSNSSGKPLAHAGVKKGVPEMSQKASQNQSLREKSHQRDKRLI